VEPRLDAGERPGKRHIIVSLLRTLKEGKIERGKGEKKKKAPQTEGSRSDRKNRPTTGRKKSGRGNHVVRTVGLGKKEIKGSGIKSCETVKASRITSARAPKKKRELQKNAPIEGNL